jgi:hypothetical protein
MECQRGRSVPSTHQSTLPARSTRKLSPPTSKGKKDEFLVADAATKGYGLLLTNNRRQLSDPRECAAIKKSRIHHVLYDQAPNLRGLGLAVAAIVAAMPMLVEELEPMRGQRLARIHGIRPTRRFDVTDPRRNPPQYWPR